MTVGFLTYSGQSILLPYLMRVKTPVGIRLTVWKKSASKYKEVLLYKALNTEGVNGQIKAVKEGHPSPSTSVRRILAVPKVSPSGWRVAHQRGWCNSSGRGTRGSISLPNESFTYTHSHSPRLIQAHPRYSTQPIFEWTPTLLFKESM